jgi:solute carrier family 30 (zinc transporter), member 9
MAGSGDSKGAVIMAVVGNGILTVLKFIAFGVSGSGAMFSEAIHSAADTGNQALLWVGIRRSQVEPTNAFPYGMGAERFFFALISAIGIFVLGCGFTLYHGVHMLMHPHLADPGWIDYTVLGISFLIDGVILKKAIGIVNQKRGDKGFVEYLKSSSDPTLLAVLAEDGVACLGVLIALAGILLAKSTGSHYPDAIATLMIAALLGGIAIWIGWKNRTLLLGPGLAPERQAEVVAFLEEQPTVEKITVARSRLLGADRYKLHVEVDWDGRVLGEGQAGWVETQSVSLGTPEGRAAFAREFGERMTEAVGDEVDRLEALMSERFPELSHLELESD